MSTKAAVKPSRATASAKGINIPLWIAQVFLAAMFLLTGFLKLTLPVEKMAPMMSWVADAPLGFVRFVGLAELAGGAGLVLPALLRIKPILTAWAATGIATILVLSIPVHIWRGETSSLGLNVILLLMALFVAWGRSKKAPIESRNARSSKPVSATVDAMMDRFEQHQG